MTKNQLWSILIKKNPSFVSKNVTFTPKGLKKLFDTVWDEGHKEGSGVGMFNSLFGKK